MRFFAFVVLVYKGRGPDRFPNQFDQSARSSSIQLAFPTMSNYFTGHINNLLPPSRLATFDDFLHTPNPGTPYHGFFEEPHRSPASAAAVSISPDPREDKPRVESTAVQGLISALAEMVEACETTTPTGEVAASSSAAMAANTDVEGCKGDDDKTVDELLAEVSDSYGSFQALQGLPGPGSMVEQLQQQVQQQQPFSWHHDEKMRSSSPSPSCSSVQEVDADATTDEGEDVEFDDNADEDCEMMDSVLDDQDYRPSGRHLGVQRGKGKGKNKGRYNKRTAIIKSKAIRTTMTRRRQNGLVANIRSFHDPHYDFAFECQAPGSPEQESYQDSQFLQKLLTLKV